MGSNSTYAISTIRETTSGTTPAGDMDVVLGSGLSPSESPSLAASQDVRADRGDADTPTTSWSATSSVNSDHRHLPGYSATGPILGARLEMYEEAFGASFLAPYDSGTVSIAVDHTTNTLTLGGGWGTLRAGDDFMLSGTFADFGPLLINAAEGKRMHAVSISGNDLAVDEFSFSTSETVADARVLTGYRGRTGTSLSNTTRTIQVFSDVDSRGDVYRRVGVTGWRLRWQWDGGATEEFQLIHGEPGEHLTAGLANTVRALPTEPDFVGCRDHAFAPEYPDAGLGYYFNGDLMDEPEFQSLEVGLTNPKVLSGGIGRQYRHNVDADGLFGSTASVAYKTLTSPGDTQQNTMWSATAGAGASFSHGFGWRTAGGGIGFVRQQNVRVTSRNPSGVTQNGTAVRTVSGAAKIPATDETQLQFTIWP